MSRSIAGLALAAVVLSAGPAGADQRPTASPRPAPGAPGSTWSSLGFLDLSAGTQAGTLGFSETTRVPIGGEDFTWTADYDVQPGLAIDASGGVRVWRRLVAAVGYTRVSDSRPAQVTGSVPHPFFFGQPRPIEGESGDLLHVEQALHLSAMWVVPIRRNVELSVFGGPSLVHVSRDFVFDVQYTESYPYDTATFASATINEGTDRSIGFNAGADVSWLLTPALGVGATARFTRASLTMDTPAGNQVAFDAGGLQVVAGIRVRFGGGARAPRPGRTGAPASRPPAPGTRPTGPATPADATLRESASVYEDPGDSRAPLTRLAADTPVRVLEIRGDWVRIEFTDSRLERRTGYVRRAAVRFAEGRLAPGAGAPREPSK